MFPLLPPKGEAITVTDALHNDMKKFVPDPLPQEKHVPAEWISAASRKLMDTRCSLRRDPKHVRQKARVLTRRIKQSLKADRIARAEKAATEIEQCLASDDLKGAFDTLK
jgi:hypothetical protein